MNTNIIAVKKDTNLHDVFTNFFEVYMKTSLPVVDDAGSLLGLVTLPTATSIPEEKRMVTVVDGIMVSRGDIIVMDLNKNAYEALNGNGKKKNEYGFCL